jgi:hypothetical protein
MQCHSIADNRFQQSKDAGVAMTSCTLTWTQHWLREFAAVQPIVSTRRRLSGNSLKTGLTLMGSPWLTCLNLRGTVPQTSHGADPLLFQALDAVP